MIELFTRKLDAIQLPEDAVLTPLPMDEDISSLSAILLDEDYYEFLKQGKITVGEVTVLDASHLIPFKAKAWMDLTDRKAIGEHVDSKNIKKHKNDVFRLTELIDPTVKIAAPQRVYADIQEFVQRMKNENVDTKQLGLVGRTKEKILEELKEMYETLQKAYQISGKLFADIAAYIDDWYVEEHTDSQAEQRWRLEALSEESCFGAATCPDAGDARQGRGYPFSFEQIQHHYKYFVEQGNYNVYEINEARFAFDQSLTEHKGKEMSLSMRPLHKRKSLLCHAPCLQKSEKRFECTIFCLLRK